MAQIILETRISAPMEVCFDLSRSVDVHLASSEHSGERVVSGRRSGLLGPGDEITWRAKHVFWQEFTSKISEYERPLNFTDVMVKGFFKSFSHRHDFLFSQGFTLMLDKLDFETGYGMLGKFIDHVFITDHLASYLQYRNAYIKLVAENPKLRAQFLPES